MPPPLPCLPCSPPRAAALQLKPPAHSHSHRHRGSMPRSSGGGGTSSNPRRIAQAYFSMPMERYSDEEDGDGIIEEDSELMPPSSLAPIVPILRAAHEIEADNPRVAYLCRLVAYERAHAMDPAATVRGVRQFQSRLVQRLHKEERETQRRLASTDAKEVQRFYERYCGKNLEGGLQMRKTDGMSRYYQTASVLFDVLKNVTGENFHAQFAKYGKAVEKEKASLHYNILPLNISGPTQPVMDIPEIKAATELLRRVENIAQPRPSPASVPEEIDEPIIRDLLDWLCQTFGFQKSNVENQKEHLILLLANIEMREGYDFHQGETYDSTIHSNSVRHLMMAIFQNYISWCRYIHLESNIKIPHDANPKQIELLYIGLYLLIWGEASNVRFMPECLCYIFHHMARDLYDLMQDRREDFFDPPFQREGSDDAFLQLIIQPIYNIIQMEAVSSKHGTVSHSKWRNYDDLNEYFWSKNCFKDLGWPMNPTALFFQNKFKRHDHPTGGQSMSKTNFVEVRTFLHLFRSFDRMWTFYILALQAMVIIAWNPSGSLSAIFKAGVFRNVLTIFITAAFLNFLQATFDIVLNWKAWRSLVFSQKIRYILKFFVAMAWFIILPTTYLISIQNHTRLVKFFGNHIGNLQNESVYNFTASLYMLPNIFSALCSVFRPISRVLERSNSRIVRFILWWTQPKLYLARGMYEDTCSLLKYTSFWILLLICKLAFSFYVEICPLVGPTRKLLFSERENHTWHELFPYLRQNLGVIMTIWAPVVMVYFMDTQIWYAIFSTVYGGVNGAFSHLGEIRTLGMLRSKFEAIPRAFSKTLVPRYGGRSKMDYSLHIDKFSDIWNAIISSLRHDDLISNRERNLLIVPSSVGDISVFQWPPFLLACKIPIALDMAKRVKKRDSELRKMINQDPYTYYAVRECYETLSNILYSLIAEPSDTRIVDRIRGSIEDSIESQSFVKNFRLEELPQLSAKFEKLLNVLLREYVDIGTTKTQITNLLQDIMEIILNDIMRNSEGIVKGENIYELFANPNLHSINDEAFRQKCVRLQLLLTMKESTIYVPTNSEARRRIIFFANSLFMKMPRAPDVHNMMSFSVLTPYYKEDVLFSAEDICKENEDGVSMLFYLRKMYPDEWLNFLERINFKPKNEDSLKLKMEDICPWASYRGQTLTRTVRGMMYYRRALEIQCIQDKTNLGNHRTKSSEERWSMADMAQAIADIKFTYVVSCQEYGMQKLSKDPRDRACYLNILNLMITYPSLRVAYIDEVEALTRNGTIAKAYYSVLVKGVDDKYDEEIYRIKLPGNPSIGEARPENQNHAIIFTRGEALQAVDMNQDNYLPEALKMRNVLEEFRSVYGKSIPTILGIREHIFTGSVSSLAWFLSNQETSFVTIGQRVLANPLKVRFHYGHPDIFNRLFHITRGGISKASKTINLSGDIFSGFNSTMRGGCATHHEYMEVGQRFDVGMNQISSFEAKVANGNGEQTLSRDVYRLGRRFDFYRMLSFYFSTVGIYFSSMVTVLTVYVFLYGRLYLNIVVSGSEKSMLLDPHIQESIKPLENALASQAVFQLGLMLILPMIMEIAVEQGSRSALGAFVMMQLQLASVFFTFQLGTRTHYYGRTILHGGTKYKPVGRGSVVYHAKFAENYRMYSRSHFVKGLELLILLVLYQAYESSYHSSKLHQFVTFSIWFLVASWLFAPFIFNPSCFERQKAVDDWMDWREWMGKGGGIGMSVEESWETWWISEHEHLRKTSIRALLLEIILSLRFLMYQYAIVHYLNIEPNSRSTSVYGLSWLVMFAVLLVLKMVSIGQQRFGTDLQLMFRILNGLIFLGLVSLVLVLFVVRKLTISGLLASILGFIPAGWCILLIAQACSPLVKAAAMWDSIMELGRAYDDMMGFILYLPIGFLSLFSFISELQTLLLFSQASTRGIQISRILAGR